MDIIRFLFGAESVENNGIDDFADVIAPTTTIHPCDVNYMDAFNCTKDAFILYERGPQIQDLQEAIPITLLYSFAFLAGIVGNLLVCVVIVRNASMRTATNYYLFNLAVSDMVYLLFGLPFEIVSFWHQYPWLFGLAFCKFRSFITEACSYASVLTIVTFSVERFLAICHPLQAYTMSGLKRVVRFIAIIWIISLLSAIPFAIYRQIFYIKYPPNDGDELPESSLCATLSMPAGPYEISTVLFFIIPMCVIVILYVCMAIKIQSRSKRSVTKKLGIHRNAINAKQAKSQRVIIKMLAAVVITFFISWAPFHAQRVVFNYGENWQNFESINNFLFTTSGFFYYIACTINPIIYSMMSKRYRCAFCQTLCGRKVKRFTSTPGQLSSRLTDGSMLTNRDNLMVIPMAELFKSETGAFLRTRSLPLPQTQTNQNQSNHSRHSQNQIGNPLSNDHLK